MQALVYENQMLYHAVHTDGKMSAGQAEVSVSQSADQVTQMRSHWRWLTGEPSNGVSTWCQKV